MPDKSVSTRKRIAVAIGAWACAIRVSAGQLECPEESYLFVHESAHLQFQVCKSLDSEINHGPFKVLRKDGTIDSDGYYLDGELHGVLRHYNPDETEFYRARYEHGDEKEYNFSKAGLQQLLPEESGRRCSYSAVSETVMNLDCDISTGSLFCSLFHSSCFDKVTRRIRARARQHFCMLFDAARLERINVNSVDRKKRLLSSESYTREDLNCSKNEGRQQGTRW